MKIRPTNLIPCLMVGLSISVPVAAQTSGSCDSSVIDTIPPVAWCAETTNPAGKNIPKAPGNGNQGQNQDGFYELLAEDNLVENCAPLQLFLTDNGTGAVFGPFEVGTKIKYTQDLYAIPEIKPIGSGKGKASAVDWHIIGTGDAVLTAYDQAGNVSNPVNCLVPPTPL